MEGIFVNNLKIKSVYRDYYVYFDSNVHSLIEILRKKVKLHVIIDSTVYRLHKNRLSWIDLASTVIKINALEKNKDIESVQRIAKRLLQNNITKKDVIVVIGGGITQDVGAFTANILKRGIDWYFIPTTLLAMCDSCIGSKVGINMSGYKNQLGIFWPPNKIFIDINFLETLEKIDILSGLGEIIKVHLIAGEKDFKKLEDKYSDIVTDFTLLKQFINRSLEIKKTIVEKDEFDIEYRHILNYGHTFGHSIEAYSNNEIPHGIGVSIGIDIANYISMNKGYISANLFDRISNTIRKNIPYQSLEYKNFNKMEKFLKGDKKFDGSILKVILCKGMGKIFIDKVKVNNILLKLIDQYAETYYSVKS